VARAVDKVGEHPHARTGLLGDTRFEASDLAIVEASFGKRPSGGCVESVFTLATQRFVFRILLFLTGFISADSHSSLLSDA
jgi:hypothetical protein